MPKLRHSARVAAVQLLYQCDARGAFDRIEELALLHFAHLAPGLDDEARAFAEGLCRGVAGRLEELDETLERASSNWKIERMSPVDRNVLRLAIFELRFGEEVPARVVLNEAIELGKELGGAESGAFINGVLNRVAKDLGANL
jgi:transcription antitermination protein NusB